MAQAFLPHGPPNDARNLYVTPGGHHLITIASRPTGRAVKNANLRSLLVQRLSDEYARKVPTYRRPRVVQAVEEVVSEHVRDGDATISKDVVRMCELQVGKFAYELASRPKTPPRDFGSVLATSGQAKVLRDEAKAAALKAKRAELVASLQANGSTEPPSIARLRQELHSAARRSVARQGGPSPRSRSEGHGDVTPAGDGASVAMGMPRHEALGLPSGRSSHILRGAPTTAHEAALTGAVRHAQAALDGAAARLEDATKAMQAASLEHETKSLAVSRVEDRAAARGLSEQDGSMPASQRSLLAGARQARDRAYMRLVEARAQVEEARIDHLRAREKLSMMQQVARSHGPSGQPGLQGHGQDSYTAQARDHGTRAGSVRSYAPTFDGQDGVHQYDDHSLPQDTPSSHGDRYEGQGQGRDQGDAADDDRENDEPVAMPLFPPWRASAPPTAPMSPRAKERTRHEDLILQATREKAQELRAAAAAKRAAIAGQTTVARGSTGYYGPAGQPTTLTTEAREAGLATSVATAPTAMPAMPPVPVPVSAPFPRHSGLLSRLQAGREAQGDACGVRSASTGLVIPSMAVPGRDWSARPPAKASGPSGRVGQDSTSVRDLMVRQEQEGQGYTVHRAAAVYMPQPAAPIEEYTQAPMPSGISYGRRSSVGSSSSDGIAYRAHGGQGQHREQQHAQEHEQEAPRRWADASEAPAGVPSRRGSEAGTELVPETQRWGGRSRWADFEPPAGHPVLAPAPAFVSAPSMVHDLGDDGQDEGAWHTSRGGETAVASAMTRRSTSQPRTSQGIRAVLPPPVPPVTGMMTARVPPVQAKPPVIPVATRQAIAEARVGQAQAREAGRPGTDLKPAPKATIAQAAAAKPPAEAAGTGQLQLQPKPMRKKVSPRALGAELEEGLAMRRRQDRSGRFTCREPGRHEHFINPTPPIVVVSRHGEGMEGMPVTTLLAQHAAREKTARVAATRAHAMRTSAATIAKGGDSAMRIPGLAPAKPRGLHMEPNALCEMKLTDPRRRAASVTEARHRSTSAGHSTVTRVAPPRVPSPAPRTS